MGYRNAANKKMCSSELDNGISFGISSTLMLTYSQWADSRDPKQCLVGLNSRRCTQVNPGAAIA